VIIGHGDIASVIPDRPDRLYFSSGVSNSGETRESEYQREINLLRKQDRGEHLVYFSSLCVFYAETRYARHKRQMEFVVKDEFRTYTIVRLGNIAWGTNPHTLINHLRDRLAVGLPLDIQPVYRHVIDVVEFRYWLGMIPEWSCEMNVPGWRMSVAQIAEEFVYEAEPAIR
jgi:hypothetical protein